MNSSLGYWSLTLEGGGKADKLQILLLINSIQQLLIVFSPETSLSFYLGVCADF